MVNVRTLVVVDMQKDFVSGIFGTEEAKEIVPKVAQKMKEYIEEGDDGYMNIICTKDTHFPDTFEDNVEGYLPAHCLYGTEGIDLVEEIDQLVNDNDIKVISKFTFGSVKLAETVKEFSDYLIETLKEEGIPIQKIHPIIEVVGLCTDICVISNALVLKATMPYADIIVDSECCAGTSPEAHEAAKFILKQNGVIVN